MKLQTKPYIIPKTYSPAFNGVNEYDELKSTILKLRKKNTSNSEIAKKIGKTQVWVLQALAHYGLLSGAMKKRLLVNEDIIRMFDEGKNCATIAQEKNMYFSQVHNILVNAGKIKSRKERELIFESNVIDYFNNGMDIESIASNLDSDQKTITNILRKHGKIFEGEQAYLMNVKDKVLAEIANKLKIPEEKFKTYLKFYD